MKRLIILKYSFILHILKHFIHYIYRAIGLMSRVRETEVQSQVESYQRLKNGT